MTYSVAIDPTALRELQKLAPDVRERISDAIGELSADPRLAGVRKLKGTTNAYRLRVRDYRVLYTITDRLLCIVVVRVGHRRDVYRG
ncbi:MAG TPA: type II toxin-antitoxin system RelE/ParE family toxin [Gemmatimonadaceae bacterium]